MAKANRAVFYENPRAWRVRVTQAAVWLLGLIIAWLAFFSGGIAASAGEQAFVWVMGVLALIVVAASPLYLYAYVVRITPGALGVRITTLTPFGQRILAVDPRGAVVGQMREDVHVGKLNVHNRWATLRLPGRTLPLLLDLTPPAQLDREAMERALAS